ncbi:hypothetical protein BH24ACT11_BH24ACT11_15610 [soil metagenome]
MSSPAPRPTPAGAASAEPGLPPGQVDLTHPDRRPEWIALAVAAGALWLAFTGEEWGRWWGDVHAWLEPISAFLNPTIGPGLPLAAGVALLVTTQGATWAQRLSWRQLLLTSWLTGLVWSVGLALIRGWSGITKPLTNDHEYLVDVPRVDDLTTLIPTFLDRVDIRGDEQWITHVAGHPPLTFLSFLWLDRIGLGGPVWGGVVITALGSTAIVAVLVTLRILGDEQRARVLAPFLVLTPLVAWSVVSADGVFMAVAAWGLAVLAAAAMAPTWPRAAILGAGAGVVLGIGINLSYGLLLVGTLALAVLAAARTVRPLLPAVLGALVVVGVFAALGFWWLEGQERLVNRYYMGIARNRPYSYWIWANLAVVCFCVGPAVVAAAGRAVAQVRASAVQWSAAWLLAIGGAAAIVVADLSGLSKSEVERIWLPFMLWLVPLVALLDVHDRRRWLAAQAGWTLLISSVLRFTW